MKGRCTICTDIVEAKYEDMHFLFDDSLYTGYPLCVSCYDDLKDKIPDYLDCIRKRIEIRDTHEFREKMKRFAEDGNFELYSTIIPDKKEKTIKKLNLEKWL